MDSEIVKDLVDLKTSERRRIWKPFMEKYECQCIAEIGVFKAQNFLKMIEHEPIIAFGIDVWREEGIPSQNDADLKQEELDEIYRNIQKMFIEKNNIKIIRDYTTKASEIFPDGFFDLIYIDADHTYEGVKKDIEAWYSKVKTGGFVTGDDYWDRISPKRHVRFGVKKAINEFAKNNNLIVHELPLHGWLIIK